MYVVPQVKRRVCRTPQSTYAVGKPLLCLTALALLTVLTARSVAAQSMQVGTVGPPPAGGTATIGGSGTTASGTYQFFDSNTSPAPLPPGTTTYKQVNVVGPSTLTLNTGGSVGQLLTLSGATVNVLGGSVSTLANDALSGYSPQSTVNVSGGFISSLSTGLGTANISGGSVDQLNIDGIANVNGGSVFIVATSGFGVADLFGGTLSNLFTNGTSTINLFGMGFTETPAGSNTFLINGVLQNGMAIVNLPYQDLNPGQDHLNFNAPVPEASTMAGFGLLLAMGGGGLAVTRRRRVRA